MTRKTFHDFPSQEWIPGDWWEEPPAPGEVRAMMPPAPWDERLASHISAHLRAEDGAARSYESLAEMGDPQVRYLARAIAADEHRHHRMLVELLDSVRCVADGDRDDSGFSTATPLDEERRLALAKAVAELTQIERSDAAELKQLRRDLRAAPGGTIWPTIVEIFALDTDKHLRILKAIERSLRRRRPTRPGATHAA